MPNNKSKPPNDLVTSNGTYFISCLTGSTILGSELRKVMAVKIKYTMSLWKRGQ